MTDMILMHGCCVGQKTVQRERFGDHVLNNCGWRDKFTDSDNNDAVIMKTVLSNTNQSIVTTALSGNNLTLDYQSGQSGTATIIVQGTSNGVHITDTFTVTVTVMFTAVDIATREKDEQFTQSIKKIFPEEVAWIENNLDFDFLSFLKEVSNE